MSSPLSSLRKTHKTPLLGGQRPVPFRNPDYSEDESKLLDEVTRNMANSRLKTRDPFLGGTSKTGRNSRQIENAPNDHELMTVMMNRISLLEQKLVHQNKEVAEKDKKINILQEKLQLLGKAKENQTEENVRALESKCLLLQQQIHEMESFLSDYGMVWVGERSNPESSVYHEEEEESEGLWDPNESVTRQETVTVDFGRIVENIRDLNVLAGDGITDIQRTTDGARLKPKDSVPLSLYANGFVMFSGPFRPYSDATSQQFIQDITDGYFPSELQDTYPDGIPITVTDKRAVHFKNNRAEIFTGLGQTLGGETKPSRLVPSNLDRQGSLGIRTKQAQTDKEIESKVFPGPPLTMDQFLHKLPQSVMKHGKIIDIRSSVASTLKGGSDGKSTWTVIDTDTVKDMKKRFEDENRPPTPRDITTLRIKSESGDHTYIVKMMFHETVGDLKNYIDQYRPAGSTDYHIVSTYPNRVHNDLQATLHDSGLTPNAVLHLRNKK